MNIHIKATGIELTDAIRKYVEKRIRAIEGKLKEGSVNALAEVEVGKISKHHQSGDIFRAEIMLSLGSEHFRAVSEKTDLYAAIDDVREKMEREITHKKEKRLTLRKKGGTAVKKLLRKSR